MAQDTRRASKRLSHWPMRFQLAKIRVTSATAHSSRFSSSLLRNSLTVANFDPPKRLEMQTSVARPTEALIGGNLCHQLR